ncbi:type II toxin-antitoxin system VapC family toxin [Halodesulfurarchaeum sp. HSR-GB]|uniref:type II toxin-antitoxin system VapC family toxin n=1 Tax=Halodesulfurarchaeum sp. HSR-GB TaxID=3074077 RepID=UPI002859BA91|nr:type II toxin-antitoxin system VapC family toxin [Halodesulfurarchaeum sp. HSR-GB]MDR5657384.1 type II toxin-antitoxin system VapC family toxin [Halodesulfurarchaeum sp. HSR-GB]
MAHYFFDTSALAKRYAQEPGTDVVDDLVERDDDTIVITSLSVVELASALRRKRNRGSLSPDDVDGLLTIFFEEALETFVVVPLDETRYETALDIVLEDDLRTLDSLQLAAALDIGADLELTFVSADRDLNEVATLRGLETLDPAAQDSPTTDSDDR